MQTNISSIKKYFKRNIPKNSQIILSVDKKAS